jgi:hypothetical protein
MWFSIFILLMLIISMVQSNNRTKKLELRLKELQWKIESMEHSTVGN